MTKIIYLLNPETGTLVGESIHPLDPVETERTGKLVYALLNPSLATDIAPPKVVAGMQAVFVSGRWTVHPIPEPEPELEPPEVPPPTVPPPTIEERANALRNHVQEYLDAMARSLGYDDIRTAVTYAEEPAVPKFQNEGKALRAWRSLVWATCYQLFDEVVAGTTPEPTMDELVGLLPRLVVPPLAAPEAGE